MSADKRSKPKRRAPKRKRKPAPPPHEPTICVDGVPDLPDEIDIIGQRWTVGFADPLRQNVLGECQNGEHVLQVRADLRQDVAEETLMHELLHACSFASGLSYSLTAKQEEAMVRALSPTLYYVLTHNKLFTSK